jgi:hypothetical protein
VKDLEVDRRVKATFLPVPGTRLTGAKIEKATGRANFHYRGTASTRSFQCKLIRPLGKQHVASRPRFSKCGATKAYTHLLPGRYTFEVRAVSAAGPDPTPAKRRFRI